MKILFRGEVPPPPKYTCQCSNCSTVVEFEQSEIHLRSIGIGYKTTTVVDWTCPICKKEQTTDAESAQRRSAFPGQVFVRQFVSPGDWNVDLISLVSDNSTMLSKKESGYTLFEVIFVVAFVAAVVWAVFAFMTLAHFVIKFW